MVLQRHGVHAPVEDEAQGIPIFIVCRQDARYEKVIEVTSQGAAVVRTVPLTTEKATGIVEKLRRRGVIPDALRQRRTLEHLLMQCSQLYLSEGLELFELAPVYLNETDYTVATARMKKRGAVRTNANVIRGETARSTKRKSSV